MPSRPPLCPRPRGVTISSHSGCHRTVVDSWQGARDDDNLINVGRPALGILAQLGDGRWPKGESEPSVLDFALEDSVTGQPSRSPTRSLGSSRPALS